ncbi:hypothetical protein [Acrocarpospora catenulata]|uniref:hypothetical protein n=1 Tax=Acrocarpospora catenulata TaxID=2836182 RepID=UPI001BD9710D|nr:hypothetical protein [Acrocarpospora catenulata]
MIFDRNEALEGDDVGAFHDLLFGDLPVPTAAESQAMFEETMTSDDVEIPDLYEDFAEDYTLAFDDLSPDIPIEYDSGDDPGDAGWHL